MSRRRRSVPRPIKRSTTDVFLLRVPTASRTLTAFAISNVPNYEVLPSSLGGSKYTWNLSTDLPTSLLNTIVKCYTYYRLNKVVFTVRPTVGRHLMNSSLEIGTTVSIYRNTPLMYRTFHTAAQGNEYGTSNDWDYFRRDNSVRQFDMFRTFTVACKPAIEMIGYESGGASAYVPKWGQWLNCATDGSVPFYGAHFCTNLVNIFAEPTNSSNGDKWAQRWTIECVCYWEFKDYKVPL